MQDSLSPIQIPLTGCSQHAQAHMCAEFTRTPAATRRPRRQGSACRQTGKGLESPFSSESQSGFAFITSETQRMNPKKMTSLAGTI